MRRALLATLLTAGLLLTAGPGLSASGDAATRSASIPGTDLAVTLPATWRTWTADGSEQPPEMWATDVATGQTCLFSLLEGVASAERAAQETVESVDAHPQMEVVERTFLNVPAGNAVRVAYGAKDAPEDDRFVLHEYYVTIPDGVLSVYCSGEDPPSDRWLRVVEAIAPTPPDAASAPAFEPRIELPERGLAVDFPAEWLVRSWPGPGPVLGGDLVLRAVTLASEDGSGGHECLIEDGMSMPSLPDGASLDEWRDTLVSIAETQVRQASKPVLTEVSLPLGRTIRADWEQWLEMPATAWVIADGDRRAALLCRSEDPPAERWQSIAESLEFLPLEE